MASHLVIIFSSIGAFLLFLLFCCLCCKCCRRKNGVNNRRNQSSGIPSFTGVQVDVPHSYYNGYGQRTNVQDYSRGYGQIQTSLSNQRTNYEFSAQNRFNTNVRPEIKKCVPATNGYTPPNSSIGSIRPQTSQRTAPIHLNVSPKISMKRKLKPQPGRALSTRDQNIEHPITSTLRTSRKRKPNDNYKSHAFDNELLNKHRTKLRRLPKRKIIETPFVSSHLN